MNECGSSASRISALLHLLRAGICGCMVSVRDPQWALINHGVAKESQLSPVLNILSPYIRHLRNMNARKPPRKDNLVNENGDITSGRFSFPRSIWSTLIPRIVNATMEIFNTVYSTELWRQCFEESAQAVVTDLRDVSASYNVCGKVVDIATLPLQDSCEVRNFHLPRLLGYLEFVLHGLGCGSMRHTEVLFLEANRFQFYDGTVYYWSESRKSASVMGREGVKQVEHKLPVPLGKLYLLSRSIVLRLFPDADRRAAIPTSTNLRRSFSMIDASSECLGLRLGPQH